MHDLPLLVTLSVALAYALAGGLLARRLGLSTIVGYLVAGMALGPFTPGYHGDTGAISQLAEFGVILLMFGIGLHFSFKDLWQVRDIAIPGALLQMAVATGLGYGLARAFGATPQAALVLGVAVSVASTVVLLRGLMDNGLLNTLHGRVAIGWLVLEDLATVVILVLLPLLAVRAPGAEDGVMSAVWAVGRALIFVVLMLLVGPRVVPAFVGRIVQTGSRELFVLVALTAAAGTALVSASVFGVSLALGAFLAGVVVAESQFSHQVGADLLPFREAFAVLFFVSVGMLVNPSHVLSNWVEVLSWTALIVVGKFVTTIAASGLFSYPARTSLIVGAGRSQIGEFSFIVGQSGMALGLIDANQYSLILAGAIISITVNPLMFTLVAPIERWLKTKPALWKHLDSIKADPGAVYDGVSDHVVIVGCGRVGRHIAEALGRLRIARIVVESDPARLTKLNELGVPVLYGDASSSEILENAGLERARAVVITLPDDDAGLAVVQTIRHHSPKLHIIARASTWEGARRMKAAGANEIVRPELEGGIEIVRRTLLDLRLPVRDVQRYAEIVRNEGLDESERPSADRARVLDHIIGASRDLEIVWVEIDDSSPLAGRTIGETQMRKQTGTSIVAISRDDGMVTNPGPDERLRIGDNLALIGTPEQTAKVAALGGSGRAVTVS